MDWTDFALEAAGRLTEPMRYDPASDKYVPVSWDEAFALVGAPFSRTEKPEPGGLLHVGASEQRSDVPLPALRT